MPRLPYEIVAFEAERIIIKMVIAPEWEWPEHWDTYISYIEACGWTRWEFDNETLKRVDRAWETVPFQNWN